MMRANGFVNTGALTFSAGGAANEADIRNTSISDYGNDASGGSNVFFTSITGDYGFAIEDIDASPLHQSHLAICGTKRDGTRRAILPPLPLSIGTETVGKQSQ
jgi:hypothetical protein